MPGLSQSCWRRSTPDARAGWVAGRTLRRTSADEKRPVLARCEHALHRDAGSAADRQVVERVRTAAGQRRAMIDRWLEARALPVEVHGAVHTGVSLPQLLDNPRGSDAPVHKCRQLRGARLISQDALPRVLPHAPTGCLLELRPLAIQLRHANQQRTALGLLVDERLHAATAIGLLTPGSLGPFGARLLLRGVEILVQMHAAERLSLRSMMEARRAAHAARLVRLTALRHFGSRLQ